MTSGPPLPNDMTGPAYHFSVDDVFDSLAGPMDGGQGLPDQPVIRFLLDLAQAYGTETDLYVFLRDPSDKGGRSLWDLPDAACAELDGLDGVRFGPHGLDAEVPPYAQSLEDQERMIGEISSALARFCRPEKLCRWVRLHYFSECYEIAPVLRARGVEALLMTDKPAITYRLGERHKAALADKGWTTENGLYFIRSHMRFESCVAEGLTAAEVCRRVEEIIACFGFVVLFTHEIDLLDPRVRDLAEACIASLTSAGVRPI